MGKNLGDCLRVFGWCCRGRHSQTSLKIRLQALIHYCGMTPLLDETGEVICPAWEYPVGGKGGVGETVMLPFADPRTKLSWWRRVLMRLGTLGLEGAPLLVQPFTESFAALDTYPELDRVYVVLATCLEPPDDLDDKVALLFGPLAARGGFPL